MKLGELKQVIQNLPDDAEIRITAPYRKGDIPKANLSIHLGNTTVTMTGISVDFQLSEYFFSKKEGK